jgi:hypothetical protein
MSNFDRRPFQSLPYDELTGIGPMSPNSIYLRDQAAKCRWHAYALTMLKRSILSHGAKCLPRPSLEPPVDG